MPAKDLQKCASDAQLVGLQNLLKSRPMFSNAKYSKDSAQDRNDNKEAKNSDSVSNFKPLKHYKSHKLI